MSTLQEKLTLKTELDPGLLYYTLVLILITLMRL